MKKFILPLGLLLLFGCHRSVDLKINGRPSEYLEATIHKTESGFRVQTTLPKGQWAVRLVGDPYPVTTEPDGSLPQCWWIVPKERLVQGRPFKLELCDPATQEPKLSLELKPKWPGQGFVEGTLEVLYWIVRPGIRS